MINNSTDFGTFNQTVNNFIPVVLNFMIIVAILLLLLTVILFGVKYFKHKKSDLLLLGVGFASGAVIILASLLVKLVLNYNFFTSPEFEVTISFIFMLLGFAIIGIGKIGAKKK